MHRPKLLPPSLQLPDDTRQRLLRLREFEPDLISDALLSQIASVKSSTRQVLESILLKHPAPLACGAPGFS